MPLLAFAWHSRHRVATELEHEASRRLHEYAKTAGILLTERLILATGELRLVALQGRKEGRRTPSRVEPLLRVVPAEQIGFDDARFVFDLTRPAGALLKVHRESPGEPPSLWLVTQVSTNGSMFAGEIDPKYLFQSEGLERPPTVLDVHLPDGTLVHSSHEGVLAQEVLHRVGLGRRARGEFSWEAEGETRVGHYREIFLAPQFGQNLVVTVHDTRASIHAPIATFEHDIALIALLTAASAALVSLVRIRKMTAPVHALEEASERLAHRDFDVHIEAKHSGELSSVIDAFNEMAANLKRRTEIMDAVNAFGASLARETDPELVIEKLVEGAETMFGVDGILVHRTGNEETLDAVRLRIRSMGLDLRSGEEELEWVGSVNPSAVTSEASVTRSISSSRSRVLRGLRVFATRLSYELLEVVELPLFAEEDEVFGVITLFNARDEHGDPSWFDEERLELASSLAGQVSAALSNVQLRTEFKALFDALIEMLAVDEKSPYTGGHCRRVPDLAMRIFEAVHAEEEGGFRDVQFDEYEAYEMQVASLLHDCGKVVTPVHVMDKSTKLETIWDRIELVDQRFSLVAKALEVEALRAVLQDAGVDVGPVMERAGRWLDSLRLDREFLRRANVGGEFMVDADVARLRSIASDWPWIDLDGVVHPFLTEDEVQNLSIRKGTLTQEERLVINRHMDVTIKMLEGLPFPRRLRNVPLIAGSHHERLDGKGFPRGLTDREIPLQGKMLAIADVFEALTAIDRPYKKGMLLSRSLEIMQSMANDGHIDPDLFGLFVRSGVWKQYAERHLGPEQCDDVDPEVLCAGVDRRKTS